MWIGYLNDQNRCLGKNNNIELRKREIIVNDKINIIIIKKDKGLYVIHYSMFTVI